MLLCHWINHSQEGFAHNQLQWGSFEYSFDAVFMNCFTGQDIFCFKTIVIGHFQKYNESVQYVVTPAVLLGLN